MTKQISKRLSEIKELKKAKVMDHGITIGTPATGWFWTDRYPFEVIKMSASGKTITIREMDATPDKENGYDYFSNQVHTFTSNENNPTYTVRATNHGWKTPEGMKVHFGYARKYDDPHF